MLVPSHTVAIDNDFRVVTEGPFADPAFRRSLECVGVDAFFRSLAPCRFHEGFEEHAVRKREQLIWTFTHNGAPYQCDATLVLADSESEYLELDDVGYVHLRCEALADTRVRIFEIRIGLHLLAQASKDARYLLLGANDFSGVAVSIAPMLSGLSEALSDPFGEAEEYGASGVFGVDSVGRFGPIDLPDFEGPFPLDAEDMPPPPKERLSAYKLRLKAAVTSGPTLVDCSPPLASSFIIANYVLKEYSLSLIKYFKEQISEDEYLAKDRRTLREDFTDEREGRDAARAESAPAPKRGRPLRRVLADPSKPPNAEINLSKQQVKLRLPPDLLNAVTEQATRDQIDRNTWIINALRMALTPKMK